MADSDSCPQPSHRYEAMEEWTCAEYNDYLKLNKIRSVVSYLTMLT